MERAKFQAGAEVEVVFVGRIEKVEVHKDFDGKVVGFTYMVRNPSGDYMLVDEKTLEENNNEQANGENS